MPANATLPLHPILRFSDDDLEIRFLDHYKSLYYRYAQWSLGLGLLLVLGDFLVDYLVFPAVSANFYRLTFCGPLLIGGLAYTFLPHAKTWWEPVLSAFIVATAGVLFWLLLLIDQQGGQGLRSWVGILNFAIVQIYCFVIIGVRFRFSLAAGFAILLAFFVAMQASFGEQNGDIAYLSYHVITVMLIVMAIGI